VATAGNGQANSVKVSVAARNAIGLSQAAALADPVWSDVIPAAPTGLAAAPLDGGLRLSWNPVTAQGGGSAVRGYVITVGGTQLSEVRATGPACTAASCTIDVPGLTNGVDVTYTVSARNEAYPALSTWNSSQDKGRPFGAPRSGGITATGTDTTGTVTVDWEAFNGTGDPILGYYVQRLSNAAVPSGAQSCSVSSPAPGAVTPPRTGGSVQEQKAVDSSINSVVFDNLKDSNATYSFVVWGYNRAGCVSTTVTSVLVRPAPGSVAGVSGAMAQRTVGTDGTNWDYQVTAISPKFDHYKVRASGDAGPGVAFAVGAWPREVLGLPLGLTVGFEVQGCTAWDACGPWFAQTAPEPSLTFAVTGLTYDVNTGIFSWTNGPANGSLPASYRCFAESDPSISATGQEPDTTCAIPTVPTSGPVHLVVTVNDHEYTYTSKP
jgi:hypothetical protein